MKSLKNLKWNRKWLRLLVLPLLVLAGCAVYIDTVVMPDMVAGEMITIQLTGRVVDSATGAAYAHPDERLVIAFIAPKSWHADENTTMSFSEPVVGPRNMVVIPDSILTDDGNSATGDVPWKDALIAKYGMGDNYLPDSLEWICFWTDPVYNYDGNTSKFNYKVTIKTLVGNQNISFKPTFAMAFTTDALYSWDGQMTTFMKKGCMTVAGGTGELLDCCNVPIQTVVPGFSLDNDIMTMTFDRKADSTATQLDNETDLFLTMKGYTADNDSINLQLPLKKTADVYSDKFTVTFWPRQSFNLSPSQTLQRISYFYTNKAADKKIGFANLGIPFIYNFKCE